MMSCSLSPGHHHWLRPVLIQAVSPAVEQCRADHEHPVRGAGDLQVSASLLRAAGSSPSGVDEEDSELPGD